MNVGTDDAATAIASPPPLSVSLADAGLPRIHNPSVSPRTPDRRFRPSVLQSFRLSKLYRDHQSNMASEAREGLQAHASHEPTHTESVHIDHVLAQCHDHLKKLKVTTLESLPPYNPRIRSKPHPQLLKERLLPVGQFIVGYLERTPEQGRGRLELLLCRRIAAEYWPLPADDATHLRIHEMYRNALYNMVSRVSDAVDSTPDPGNGGD
jgi:hypothetical protein